MPIIFPTGRQARLRALLLLTALGAVAGCATLPSNGPTARQIVAEQRKDNPLNFQIVDIDMPAVQRLESRPDPNPSRLAALAAEGEVDMIGPGDVLGVQLFEVGARLFSGPTTTLGVTGGTGGSGAAQAVGGGSQSLGAGVTVDRDGTVTLPYVGRITVAGLTAAQAQRLIERKLQGLSQQPQVLVSIAQNVSNTVVVMGSVVRPGRQPLTLAREHLLDAVASAGGVNTGVSTGNSTGTGTGPQDMVIRFTRLGRTVEQALETIVSGSADDLTLLPGDRIEVLRQPRSFIVFGATGRVSQVPFESRRLSLAEAVARAGGPSDAQADPSAVFVFRFEAGTPPGAALPPAPVPGTPPQPVVDGKVVALPTVYRLNLNAASGYFLSQQFEMRDKDVIYIANARSNQPRKLAEIVNLLFSPLYTIRAATQ